MLWLVFKPYVDRWARGSYPTANQLRRSYLLVCPAVKLFTQNLCWQKIHMLQRTCLMRDCVDMIWTSPSLICVTTMTNQHIDEKSALSPHIDSPPCLTMWARASSSYWIPTMSHKLLFALFRLKEAIGKSKAIWKRGIVVLVSDHICFSRWNSDGIPSLFNIPNFQRTNPYMMGRPFPHQNSSNN